MSTKGADMYSKLRQFLENRFQDQTKYTHLRTFKDMFCIFYHLKYSIPRLVYLEFFSDCKQSDHVKYPCSQFRGSKKQNLQLNKNGLSQNLERKYTFIFLCTLKKHMACQIFLKRSGAKYYIFSLLTIDSTETVLHTHTHTKLNMASVNMTKYRVQFFRLFWKLEKCYKHLGRKPCLTQFFKTLSNNLGSVFSAYLAHRKANTSFLNWKFHNRVANQRKSQLLNLKIDWVLGDISNDELINYN